MRSLLPTFWLVGLFAGWAGVWGATGADGGVDFFTGRPTVCAIELSPASLQSLRVKPRQYVPAIVRVQDTVFKNVGVHLKGSATFQPVDQRPSLTLDFGRFSEVQLRPRKIHLNNSLDDLTTVKEPLASEVFRQAGLPVPRMAHTAVFLNGRALGVYVLKEGYTEEFADDHFGPGGGHFYDTEQGHDVDLPMKRHFGRGAEDGQPDLQRLARAAREPDLEKRWLQLRQALDMDRFLKFMALEIMLGHWDGYCLARNNFRIYSDPTRERLVFLPTGLDQVFAKADLPWKPEMTGLVAQAVLETPEGRRQYEAQFRALFGRLFDSARLADRARELVMTLQPLLGHTFSQTKEAAEELCQQIHAREMSLRQQLRQPDLALLDFRDGKASLTEWKAVDEPLGGRMQESSASDPLPSLKISAGPKTSASWRQRVRLQPGHYRFAAQVTVKQVAPLPFGENQGASLRILGRPARSGNLVGTRAWERLQVAFEIEGKEEEVVLICELRAQSGEACFARDTLLLERVN